MLLENDLGSIEITNDVFTTIAGCAATHCFGVKGMAVRTVSDGLVHLLKREALNKGVKVGFDSKGRVEVDLHIIVEYGVNISAISRSIISEVRYFVEKLTGVKAGAVNVYVDSVMKSEK